MGSSPKPPVKPNATNDRQTWATQVALLYLEEIITGNQDDTPGGMKLPGSLKKFVGAKNNLDPTQTLDTTPLFNWLVNWAMDLANNWGTYGSGLMSIGWSMGPPPAGDTLDVDTQSKIYEIDVEAATRKYEADKRFEAEKYQADKQVESATIYAGATKYAADRDLEAAKEQAAATRYSADRQLEGTKYAADTDLQIAKMAEEGRNRRFDLQLAEDQRQFNALLALDLYKLGVELSRNPVDWIAYQYYLSGYGLPATGQTLMAAPAVFGAIPPVGPSNFGAVTGGPAVYTGQWDAAASTGAVPGFYSVSSALFLNPGLANPQYAQQLVQEWDRKQTQAREQLALETGMQEYMQAANLNLAASYGQDPVAMVTAGGQVIDNAYSGDPLVLFQTSTTFRETLAQDPGLYQRLWQEASASAPDLTGGPLGVGQWPAPASGAGGVTPVNAPGPTSQTGLITQLQGLVDQAGGGQNLAAAGRPDLLPGQYTPQQIMQNPFVQAVASGQVTPLFRKEDPTGWNRFGSVPALNGMRTGIRSGQDLNFNAFMKMLPSQQQMLQGLMEATGQYWKDNVEQMLRTSPGGLSPLQGGATGVRRF